MAEAREHPGEVVLLYGDEVSFYRQPTQGNLFAPRGRIQPPMRVSARSNTVMRIGGFLDAVSGAVYHWESPKITVQVHRRWWLQLAAANPKASKIYVVLDNLPNHHHPAATSVTQEDPRINLLYLPVYAPWLNPIEKLWRYTKQTVCHAHRYCDDFKTFSGTIHECLTNPMNGPKQLLQYVGLIHQ